MYLLNASAESIFLSFRPQWKVGEVYFQIYAADMVMMV